MTSELATFMVKVTGRVQGVGYRAWVKKKAKNFELLGWVMNSDDKSVIMEISGKKKKIKMFLIECYKGPIFSNVLDVKAKKASFKFFESFDIRFK
ncbi:MAG: acylphosphatase [Pseudomonadota bacterium]|nr:acylphosphatase [Pseudomonadota bacterium]